MAKPTKEEKTAAKRQTQVAEYNAGSVKNQLNQSLENYDFANAQNAALRDVQFKQNARKAEADRFELARNLQNAALGLLGATGTAMNGSTTGNILSMLASRNDADNSVTWQQQAENNNAVQNAYDEAFNQNQVAKREAAINASKALRDTQADISANLSNINADLYKKPGSNKNVKEMQTEANNARKAVAQNNAQLSGYLMPDNSVQNILPQRNTIRRNDYFSQLLNSFNSR